MAQSKSTSPKRVSKATDKKYFTLETANRAIPYVRRIINDVVAEHHKVVVLQEALSGSPTPTERPKMQTEFQRRIEHLQELTSELAAVGVELKDYSTGLIDFRGKHRGEDVYLCWRLGEDQIAFFHELNAGFAGRRPIAELEEK